MKNDKNKNIFYNFLLSSGLGNAYSYNRNKKKLKPNEENEKEILKIKRTN